MRNHENSLHVFLKKILFNNILMTKKVILYGNIALIMERKNNTFKSALLKSNINGEGI